MLIALPAKFAAIDIDIIALLSLSQTAGIIEDALEAVLKHTMNRGIVLQQQLTKYHNIDDNAVTTITNYVHTKYQVIRMVTIGHIMERWLKNI